MTPAATPFAFPAKPTKACGSGGFLFAVIGMDHGHIDSQAAGLIDAGGELVWAYDPDPAKLATFCARFPQARPARSESEILEDPRIRAVTAAAVPDQRCALGIRVMEHGKDYLTDKAGMTTLEHVEAARAVTARTGRKYLICYGRVQGEASAYTESLIAGGAIGRVVNVIGLGPHRLNAGLRPPWFFDRQRSGGILCDLGSHQTDQFLAYTGGARATITASRIANYKHPQYPDIDDFGDASLRSDNGATGFFRVDWLTPDGLKSWGDTRTIVMGTDGYIELRPSLDITREPHGDHLFLVDHHGEHYLNAAGKIGIPFYGRFVRDCLDRTETAMTQAHAFQAAELCIRAQQQAIRVV